MTLPAFIASGIRFACVDCGQCCTGAPGVVRMTDAEVPALAGHLGISPKTVKEKYLSPTDDGWRIKETPNGDCVFFDERCTIYPVRPTQCRTYPFWFKNLRSEEAWRKTAVECPGIGQGRIHTAEEILDRVHEDMAAPHGTRPA